MPYAELIAFTIAPIGVAWAFAFAIVHICRLVEKVAKLNASNSVIEYRHLMQQAGRQTRSSNPQSRKGRVMERSAVRRPLRTFAKSSDGADES